MRHSVTICETSGDCHNSMHMQENWSSKHTGVGIILDTQSLGCMTGLQSHEPHLGHQVVRGGGVRRQAAESVLG